MATDSAETKLKLCWECVTPLLKYQRERIVIDGHLRTVHKYCADEIRKESPERLK